MRPRHLHHTALSNRLWSAMTTFFVWGLGLMLVGASLAGCSDDVVGGERDFFEPRTMSPYEFDGEPQIEGPEQLQFVGLQVGETGVNTAQIRNVGRAGLDIEAVSVLGPFELLSTGEFDAAGKHLAPGESVAIEVAFQSVDDIDREGVLRVNSSDPNRPQLDIELVAKVDTPCPQPVIVGTSEHETAMASPQGNLRGLPLETVEFDATDSEAAENRHIEHYEWSLVEWPQDTFVTLEESAADPMNALYLELSGTYVVELHVWDDLGVRSCEPARLEIEAVSGDAIHLQLVWDTPADPDRENDSGSDLDLHFLHENGHWNRSPYDCHWVNPNPNWGDPNDARMNPRLDIDQVHGWGPENINLEIPEEGVRYGVGVNYFDDHGYGPSYATVRVFIDGLLRREFTDRYMEDRQFWHVADIDWPSAEITERGVITDGIPVE